ncbi:uncharacterized protein BDV17DRAFT_262334 [Aspergillus undulatus]|uniref:uncharacterized protein n=1 Tax=Aspergillus undulatus TaxID=1810928 RepID=UPI003CCD1FDF
MPIPTRSVPIKDPRKQPATAGRAVSNLKPPSAATNSTDETPSKPTSPKNAPSTLPTRRQSLIRPSSLKPPSSASSKSSIPSAGTRTVGRGPASPVKNDDTAKQQSGRPTSPKKTDMPPPPRPVRSASLRQPPSSTTGTLTAPRGHMRHRSQVVTPSSKPLQTASAATTSRSRNQFSTYQQQFSPKKATNPPTPMPSTSLPVDQASSLIPSSWPEIAALQTELLQLSLLHQSGLQRNGQWESEVEAQLRSKYNSVAGDYRAILTEEKESQRKVNAQALQYWLKNAREHNGQHGFAEQVWLLSQVAQEMYDISDVHGGRYTMAILEFESWLQKVEGVRDARCRRVTEEESDDFINPIHREWKEETNALIMKLELLARQLQSLDILGYGEVEALDSSALLRTAKGLNELVSQMVDELRIVRRIEADIVKTESQRVSQLAQHLVDMQPRKDPAVPETGLWTRTFTS